MMNTQREEFVKRQAQWDAFHRWESCRDYQSLSLEERLDWYISAFNLVRGARNPVSLEDIEIKVRFIRNVRDRLAHMK
jgi:hypothetical protein